MIADDDRRSTVAMDWIVRMLAVGPKNITLTRNASSALMPEVDKEPSGIRGSIHMCKNRRASMRVLLVDIRCVERLIKDLFVE
jgi:hypothetical protein